MAQENKATGSYGAWFAVSAGRVDKPVSRLYSPPVGKLVSVKRKGRRDAMDYVRKADFAVRQNRPSSRML